MGSRTLALKSRSMRYQQRPQGTCRNADSHGSLLCYLLRVRILTGSQVTPCTLKFEKYHCSRKLLFRCQTTSYKHAWQSGLYIRITGRTFKHPDSPICIPDHLYQHLLGIGPRQLCFKSSRGDSDIQPNLKGTGLKVGLRFGHNRRNNVLFSCPPPI